MLPLRSQKHKPAGLDDASLGITYLRFCVRIDGSRISSRASDIGTWWNGTHKCVGHHWTQLVRRLQELNARAIKFSAIAFPISTQTRCRSARRISIFWFQCSDERLGTTFCAFCREAATDVVPSSTNAQARNDRLRYRSQTDTPSANR